MNKIEERKMTWEEQVQWVIRNTNVELENLAIVERVYDKSTPTKKITMTNNGVVTVRYE